MKKITTKRYRIRNGEKKLEIVDVSIQSKDAIQKVMNMVDENGVMYKVFDTRIENGNIVSNSHFSKDGSMKYKDIYEYFENGDLKERKTLNTNGEVTYFKTHVLDKGGNLIFTDSSNDFSYNSNYFEKSIGKKISSQTTYAKGQPYLATSHSVTIFNGDLIEKVREYEGFVDTEEGFYPSQDHIEYQFEYYGNGNKKRNIIYSFWRNIKDGKVITGRYLSEQKDFDENGLLLCEKQGDKENEIFTTKSYEYEFNDKSEWIERKCCHKGELFEIAKREIEEKTDENNA